MNGDRDPFTDFVRKQGLDTNKEPKPPEKLFVDLGALIANGLEPERPGVARVYRRGACFTRDGSMNSQ